MKTVEFKFSVGDLVFVDGYRDLVGVIAVCGVFDGDITAYLVRKCGSLDVGTAWLPEHVISAADV